MSVMASYAPTSGGSQHQQQQTRLRLRDLGVLVLSAVAIVATFHMEGSVTLHTAFTLPTLSSQGAGRQQQQQQHHYANGHFPSTPNEWLPPPKVSDVDLDGVQEILVATYEPALRMYVYDSSTTSSSTSSSKESALVEKHWVSLAGDIVGMKRLRQAATMEVGTLRPGVELQVVAVLTKGLSVLCYSADLKLLWEHVLQQNMPAGSHIMESSIVVAPANTQHTSGLVIVGVRVNAGGQGGGKGKGTTKSAFDSDDDDDDNDKHNDGKEGGVFGTEGHFSYFALHGSTGDIVWKHEEGDFLDAKSGPREQREYMSEHFKADARIPLKHRGEEDWRQYRSAMLQWAMPHRWFSRDDTHVHLAHFEKNRRVGGQGGPGRSTKQRHDEREQIVGGSLPSVSAPPTTTTGKQPLARLADDRVQQQQRVAQTLGFSGGGLEALQETLFPDSAARTVDTSSFNVVVAHLHDAVEVLHLNSGQPLCRVRLGGDAHGEAAMSVDVNGDGVLDYVAAYVGENDDRVFRARGAVPKGSSCYVLARSGVPPIEPLFNGSLCDGAGVLEDLFSQTSRFVESQGASYGKLRGVHDRNLEAVAPLAVPRLDQLGVVTFDSVFLVSDGKLTSYGPTGAVNWHVETPAWWFTAAERSSGLTLSLRNSIPEAAVWSMDTGSPSAFRASLSLMTTKTHAPVTTQSILIVVLGWTALLLVDPLGNTVATLSMIDQGAAIHNPVFADLNGDGYTDILLVRRNRIDGIIVEHHAGMAVFSVLVYGLLAVLVILFVRRVIQNNASHSQRHSRRAPASDASEQLRRGTD